MSRVPSPHEGRSRKAAAQRPRRVFGTHRFAELTEKWLRRGTHRSTRELEDAIRTWIDTWNEDPRPFVWHKNADEILDTVAQYVNESLTQDALERKGRKSTENDDYEKRE